MTSTTARVHALVLGLTLGVGGASALAEKPDWAGKPGKGEKHQKEHRHDDRAPSRDRDRGSASSNIAINVQIGGYFAEPQRLAAREYYAPQFRAVPPSGHKYVRVAADILLIAIGTGLVVDAIEDLCRF